MFNLIPNRAEGRVRGLYHAGFGTVGIDLGNYIFDQNREVEYHEYTHYHLSKFTNFGLFYSIFQEILFTKAEHLIVPKEHITASVALMHYAMYLSQEGLAHLMQARLIHKEGGMDAVKEFEGRIDNMQTKGNPKIALSHCRKFVDLAQAEFDAFMAKMSVLALNTGILKDCLANPQLITDISVLRTYLADKNNSPDDRFVKLCGAFEKDISMLSLPETEIAQRVGLIFWDKRTNLEQANILNVCSEALTDTPANIKEEDIQTLEGVDVYKPALERLILRDTNIERDALAGVPPAEFLDELKHLRTLFLYIKTSFKLYPNEFPFFSFSKARLIINSAMPMDEAYLRFVNRNLVTKVIDTNGFNYKTGQIVDRFSFTNINIVWYKTAEDFQLLLNMLTQKEQPAKCSIFQLSEELKYTYYVVKIPDTDLLHIFVGLPYHYREISKVKTLSRITQDELWTEILNNNEVHINNFSHDLIGIPYAINLIDSFRDPDAFTARLERAVVNGIRRKDLCICGSMRQFKYCHGYR